MYKLLLVRNRILRKIVPILMKYFIDVIENFWRIQYEIRKISFEMNN